MTNTTVPTASGAMSSGSLTLINLVNAETGETNLAILKGMTRRRAVNEYGCLSPYALRQTLKYYGDIVAQLKCGWRQAHGLPVATTMVTPHGISREGVRRSIF
jgi:hypothetical protein